MTGRTRQAGFTLVELLTALAVLGLLSTLMFGELRFGARVWETTERVVADAEAVGAAQTLLRQKLAAAYPILSRATDAQRHVEFDGTRETLRFVSFLPERSGANITARVALTLASAGDTARGRLIAGIRPDLGAGSDGWPPTETVLLDGIESVTLAYFGAIEPGGTPAWHDAWTNRLALPQLVRVAVRFPDGDRRVWPDLVVSPRIQADASCQFDPLIRDCRPR